MLQIEGEPGATRIFSAPSRPSFSGQVCAASSAPATALHSALSRTSTPPPPRATIGAATREAASPAGRSPDRRSPLLTGSDYPPGLALPISILHARNPIECAPRLRTAPIPRRCSPGTTATAATCPGAPHPAERPDPYRVWLSEIMLQQTTVATVGPYFDRFVARFPDIRALAAASLDEVLHAWQGLGYYARARNLHACARAVVAAHGGRFPDDPARLRALPGIGDYTAAAIAAIAFDRPVAAVDGNVERVVARLFAERDAACRAAKPRLRALAAALVPEQRAGDFAQAMMDLGATLCTPRAPRCVLCPWRADCAAAAARALPRTCRCRPRSRSGRCATASRSG